jgi:hypothetical protein
MRSSLLRHVALVLGMLGAQAAGARPAEFQAVGTLFAPRPAGLWLVDGAPALDGGAVRDGAEVRLKDGVSPDDRRRASVQVVYSVPRKDPYVCRGSDPCASGFRIIGGAPVDDVIAKMSATGRLMHAGVMPELAGARGIAQETVDDGVVARDGDRIAIGPLIASVEAGSYQAVIVPEGAAALTVPLTVAAKSSVPAVVVPHATDGLYTLMLRSPNGRDILSGEAAFLAVGADRFAASKSAYDAAVALTRSWSKSPRNAELSTIFLRRVLAGLSERD